MIQAFTKLKIAVLAPIPSASVSTTTSTKPGLFRKCRTASLRPMPTGYAGWPRLVQSVLIHPSTILIIRCP